jgi:hypothetical protein
MRLRVPPRLFFSGYHWLSSRYLFGYLIDNQLGGG